MSKHEKEDKGGEEAGTKNKSAKKLGRELLRAAEKGDVERVRELLQCEGVDVRHHEQRDWRGDPKTVLVVACEGTLKRVTFPCCCHMTLHWASFCLTLNGDKKSYNDA
jgi:hypothetical protein